jgi:hypothetical protein
MDERKCRSGRIDQWLPEFQELDEDLATKEKHKRLFRWDKNVHNPHCNDDYTHLFRS